MLLGSANPARILPLAGQMNAMASASGLSSFERIATFSLEYGRRTAFGSVFAAPSPRPCCGTESRGLASTRPAPRAGATCTALRSSGGLTRSTCPMLILVGSSRPFHCATSR